MEGLQSLALDSMLRNVSSYTWTLTLDSLYPFTFGTMALTLEDAQRKMISTFKKIEKLATEINEYHNTEMEQYVQLSELNNELTLANNQLGQIEGLKHQISNLEDKISKTETRRMITRLSEEYKTIEGSIDDIRWGYESRDRLQEYKDKMNKIYSEIIDLIPKDQLTDSTKRQIVTEYIYMNTSVEHCDLVLNSYRVDLLKKKNELSVLEQEHTGVEQRISECSKKIQTVVNNLNKIKEDGNVLNMRYSELGESLNVKDANILSQYFEFKLCNLVNDLLYGEITLEQFIMNVKPSISKLNITYIS